MRFPKSKIDDNSLIFFDEIQECPRARLAFKNFANTKYNVIGRGSYLGISGYNLGDAAPAPIGYEEVFNMKTMDFEEFLWANGYQKSQTDELINYFKVKKPVPENLHILFKNIYLKYACIGGFPRVVLEYCQSKNLASAYQILSNIVFDMKSDFGRRKGKDGLPYFKQAEVSRIQNVFDLIPTFLAKENKRFIVSKVKGGLQYDKNDAIEYLKQAHVVSKVYNLEVPSLPLCGEKIEKQFKVFPEDIGIVTSMYGIDTVVAINKGILGQGKGAVYEALAFDGLIKANITPYYFAKNSGLKIDFVISYEGYPALVECKAKNGNTKSSKTVMNHPEHYGKTKLLKIGNYNISQEGDITTIPHYLVFALENEKIDI